MKHFQTYSSSIKKRVKRKEELRNRNEIENKKRNEAEDINWKGEDIKHNGT